MRIIGHVDMDAFFAAVEQRDEPRLRGKPLVIGGHKHSPRGVVSTCSYEARRFGIHSAMPISKAAQLCPQGIFMPGNMGKYKRVSAEIFTILAGFSPTFEPVSIDEAYLDLTECYQKYPSLWALGLELKKAIRERLLLTASVGLAGTKSAAKIASEMQKPDGLTIILPEDFDRVIGTLPVRKLHGVGEKTAQRMEKLGLKTVLDIRRIGRRKMVAFFGKQGDWIYNLSCGIDPRPVEKEHTRKSIGRETTFDQDLQDEDRLLKVLEELSADIARRLKDRSLWGETITLKLRKPDFLTSTHSLSLKRGISTTQEIYQAARLLFDREWRHSGRPPLRLIGLSITNLSAVMQMDLFQPHRLTKVDQLLANLGTKFGTGTVTTGRAWEKDSDSD